MTPSPNQDQILTQMRAFLLAVLPDGVDVIAGQPNRVPEPKDTKFVIMSPPRFERIETNIDEYLDAKFTGSIAGATMNITYVYPNFPGEICVGSVIFGVGVVAGTKVIALGTGTGGIGTYTVSPSQTILAETLAAGVQTITQPAKPKTPTGAALVTWQ